MDTRKDVARRKAVRALELIREGVTAEFGGDLTRAADQFGIAQSTFYRIMAKTPDKIDVIFLATVADWLHDHRGHEDFAALWRRVTREIEEQPELGQTDTGPTGLVHGAQPLT